VQKTKKQEEIMKKLLLAAAVVVIGIGLAGNTIAAETTGTVGVTATVSAKCTYTAPGALTIDIDPTLSGAQNMTPTQPQVKCTNKKTVTISAYSAGSLSTSSSGTLLGSLTQAGFSAIPYTFTFAASCNGKGFGSGSGTDLLTNIGGSVSEVDAQAAEYATGSYTDTVTLTLTY
jgi:spore coat protein U-like protein